MINTSLLWLLLVPIVFSGILYFILLKQPPLKNRFSSRPHPIAFSGISLLIGLLITTVTFFSGLGYKTQDYEVWNGQITGKAREEVSCRHSYSCNCRTVCSGSGEHRSCSTVCDTCYEHSYDVDWLAHSTIGGFDIQTIDRQGLREPPRWTAVQPGQPAARVSGYTNYIKAVPESVMHFSSDSLKQKFVGKIPQYPLSVYDYHYIDRVLPVGINLSNIRQWNMEISNMLRTLGHVKQVNVVLIPTNITDKDYVYAVRDAWLGGKKNDVIIIVSITEYPKINWVGVLSWSDRELFKVVLRDELQEAEFEVKQVTGIIERNITKLFERKRMRDFKYLENEIDPPEWAIWTGVVLNAMLIVGMLIGYRRF